LDECSPWGASRFKARLRDDTEPAGQRHDGRAHGAGGAARLGMSTAARRLQLGVEAGALLERVVVARRCTSRWWLRDAARPAGDDVSQRIQKAPTQRSLPPFSSSPQVRRCTSEQGSGWQGRRRPRR
jgi:hypothetical protein